MHFNNTKSTRRKQPLLTDKQVNEIEKRQKLAIMLNAQEKIEDYKDKVFGIIDSKGLDNADEDKSLKTALQVLEYIIPKKKSSEVTITARKLEDIITESIEEAQIIDTTADNSIANITHQVASNDK